MKSALGPHKSGNTAILSPGMTPEENTSFPPALLTSCSVSVRVAPFRRRRTLNDPPTGASYEAIEGPPETPELPALEETEAAEETDEEEELLDPEEHERMVRHAAVAELIEHQPDEVAALLRSWLGDRRAVQR